MITKTRDTLVKTEKSCFYLITIIIAILIGSTSFLPMMDLPQHAGQVELLRATIMGETGKPWFNILELNVLTTYWITYLPASLLALFLPVNYAINIIVAISFLLFILSFSALRKHFGSPALLDWILLPTFFGFCYILGFITFILAIPIGILLLVQQLKFLDSGNNRNAIIVIITGIFLYFSHILIFLFFCQISVFTVFADRRYTFKEKLARLYPFYFLSTLLIAFLLTSDFFSNNGLGKYFPSAYDYNQGVFAFKVINFLIYPFNIFKGNFVLAYDLTTMILLTIPFLMEYRLSRDPKRYVPLICFMLVWIFLPSTLGKTSFIYHRFSIFLIPFYILIFDKNSTEFSGLKNLSIQACAVVWVVLSLPLLKPPLTDLFFFNRETRGFALLIEKLPEEKMALSLIYDTDSEGGRGHPAYAYFPLWYQALKKGWVEFNFAWFSPQPFRYKSDSIPENRPGFAWNPNLFSSFQNCDKYQLLFVRIKGDSDKKSHDYHMRKSKCSHTLKFQDGLWNIYALD